MYKIFVNSLRCKITYLITFMKNLAVLAILLVLLSCSDRPIINNCFEGITINATVNLSNPEFVDLQVPNGYTETNLSGRRILLIRGNSRYRAFDLQCPERDCNTPMQFDGLLLDCSCSGKQYNYLQGGVPQDGEGCSALEYTVSQTGSDRLQITR